MSVTLILGAPLCIYPIKATFCTLIWHERNPTKQLKFIVITGLVFSAMLLALMIPGLSMILTVLGSVSAPQVMFILDVLYLAVFILPKGISRKMV